MSFFDTFWKVWEVRTSVKIQESLEDYFNKPTNFDNTKEISNVVLNNHHSWNEKLNKNRSIVHGKIYNLNCEYCSKQFPFLKTKLNTNLCFGYIFHDKIAYKTTEEKIIEISNKFNVDCDFKPLFYCSKKCLLDDSSIQIERFV